MLRRRQTERADTILETMMSEARKHQIMRKQDLQKNRVGYIRRIVVDDRAAICPPTKTTTPSLRRAVERLGTASNPSSAFISSLANSCSTGDVYDSPTQPSSVIRRFVHACNTISHCAFLTTECRLFSINKDDITEAAEDE